MAERFLTLNRPDYHQLRRVHVLDPLKWAVMPGTDFWIMAGANGQGTASGNNLLTDGGWTTTSIAAYAAGTAADFMTKADVGTPANYTTDAAADLIQSSAIFGDYHHAHQAAVISGMNVLPRFLVCDIYALFSTASADEQTSNVGLVQAGGSIVTSANAGAVINTDSTNWRFQVGGATRGTNTTNVAVDNAAHWFRLLCDRQVGTTGTCYAYVDATQIGSQALKDDSWPVSFGAGNGTTNRVQLTSAHIWYAWSFPPIQYLTGATTATF